MKKIAIAATFSIGLFGLVACSSDSSDSEVVAETNIGDITKDDFYEELKDVAGESVLQNLIFTKILEDEFGEVTDKDIDNKIDEFKDQFGEQYPMWLQENGIQDDESASFRSQVGFIVLQEKAQYEGIEVSDEEVKEKFDEMKENDQHEIKASHILVEDKKEAEDIKKELDEGGDFAELAKEHSIDGSAENGGDLGFFSKQGMIPEFSDVAFELDVDEISDPVESEHGYHIIKVTEIADLDDMEDDIRLAIREEKAQENQQAVSEKIDGLVEDADIDIKIDEYKDLFELPEDTPEVDDVPEADNAPDKDNETNENEDANSNNDDKDNNNKE